MTLVFPVFSPPYGHTGKPVCPYGLRKTFVSCPLMLLMLLMLLSCNMGGRRQGNESVQCVHTCFWDSFDFKDTTLIHKPEITEQKFADFALVLSNAPDSLRRVETDTLLLRALRGGMNFYAHFMELAEKYLENPNSPYRNEECFIPFLEFAVNSTALPPEWKERPRHRLERTLKNRKGAIATDFNYVTESGKSGNLHSHKNQYILLFFFNPGCQDCGRVAEYIQSSTLIQEMVSSHRLLILSVYPDEYLEEWNLHLGEHPKEWITARMPSEADRQAFWLPAIPNLYLLNSQKRVLLKDAAIETIESYLEQRPTLLRN